VDVLEWTVGIELTKCVHAWRSSGEQGVDDARKACNDQITFPVLL
jgi:hypothetical protein